MNKKQDSVNDLFHRSSGSAASSYIKSLFAPEDVVLKNTIISIENNNLRPINVGADEGKLLQILIKLHGSITIVEVGTLVGYSTIWLARALPENGKIYSFEKDERIANIARDNILKSDVAHKIEVISGDAHEMLKTIEDKATFDAIFIDAEKGGYCKYLDWAEKNIRKGGLIIGDNTFMHGEVFLDEPKEKMSVVMKQFNQRLADDNKYDGIIIPTNAGLTVAIKK